jgi:hypothetical protein
VPDCFPMFLCSSFLTLDVVADGTQVPECLPCFTRYQVWSITSLRGRMRWRCGLPRTSICPIKKCLNQRNAGTALQLCPSQKLGAAARIIHELPFRGSTVQASRVEEFHCSRSVGPPNPCLRSSTPTTRSVFRQRKYSTYSQSVNRRAVKSDWLNSRAGVGARQKFGLRRGRFFVLLIDSSCLSHLESFHLQYESREYGIMTNILIIFAVF